MVLLDPVNHTRKCRDWCQNVSDVDIVVVF